MLATGQALERYAEGRAERELSALLARRPGRPPLRATASSRPPPVEVVAPGDLLLVKPGEVVPVDGLVVAATGRPRRVGPHRRVAAGRPADAGEQVASGVGQRRRRRSTCGRSRRPTPAPTPGIVRLVREAQASKAPFVRLADRYAVLFLPVTPGDRRAGLARLGRPGPRPRGPRRRDPLPAPPRRPDRDRRRDLARGPARHHRQGRRRARGARPARGSSCSTRPGR